MLTTHHQDSKIVCYSLRSDLPPMFFFYLTLFMLPKPLYYYAHYYLYIYLLIQCIFIGNTIRIITTITIIIIIIIITVLLLLLFVFLVCNLQAGSQVVSTTHLTELVPVLVGHQISVHAQVAEEGFRTQVGVDPRFGVQGLGLRVWGFRA